MEKKLEVSLLLDFYGELLKPSCRQATDLYCNDDLSPSEIAQELGITRQGVLDKIRRSEQQLYELEQKLGMMRRFRELEAGLDDISRAAGEIAGSSEDEQIRALALRIGERAAALKE